jgi:serine/threonine-protein kinase
MEQIGDYVTDTQLGQGAFGTVYRGHHRGSPDTAVALKLVPHYGSADKLLLEPALLAKLDHPGIVHLQDYFLQDDMLVMAMELVDGEDLKTCVDRGEQFDADFVRELLIQVGSALAHAHARKIVHRDIKLSNILVDRSKGRVRFVLTDFGIGRVDEGVQRQKLTGGTYYFMAPEQLRGRSGAQSDLWSLGVVAYRLLAGRMPFEGRNIDELTQQICFASLPPLSLAGLPPLAADLESAVIRLLEKNLNDRTGSAEELLRGLAHSAPPATKVPGSSTTATLRATHNSLDAQLRKRMRRWRILLILAAILFLLQMGLDGAVLLGASISIFYIHERDQRRSRRRLLLAAALAAAIVANALNLSGHSLKFTQLDVLAQPMQHQIGFGGLAGVVAALFVVFATVFRFLIGPLAANCYARVREIRRDLAIRQAALDRAQNPGGWLPQIEQAVNDRFEDVGFHLKYVEGLALEGRLRDVAVEARLVLLQDPYNFNGNLALAGAYFELGLIPDCLAICNAYLQLAGYCFEFAELKDRCLRRLEATA